MDPRSVDDVVALEVCQHRAPLCSSGVHQIPCWGLMAGRQIPKKAIPWLTRAARYPLQSNKTDGTRWGYAVLDTE